ncbi:MAG: MotA/TolQ/ExbB proton channel family protein [Elusimicrobiales bacterium]|nr:MotA/TolQ/ExbB proton channel family protein [Elusimicrobiales bacterium]
MSGILLMAGMLGLGVYTRQFSDALFNFHGVYIVLGGTFVAMLINSPLRYLAGAVRELGHLFREGEVARPENIIRPVVELAEQCRMRGLSALKEADPKVAGGFLERASMAALEYNDSNFVRQVLEQEINQGFDEMNEVANVYRTMGLLAPMFGLLGTLIGIIAVLKEISNPEAVGPAMAVAITSAFYGILFSNMICVPVAGKLRSRALMGIKMKSMILDGIMEIMKGSLPMVVERRLQAYK